METTMERPMRYFLATQPGDNGGTIWINSGTPIEDPFTKKVSYVNSKTVQVDNNGVLITNDPETVVSIFTNPKISRMFIDIETGKVNELFLQKRDIDFSFAKKYGIDLEKHYEEVRKAISEKKYSYTIEKDLRSEMAIEENKRQALMLEKSRLDNEELAEEIERKKAERAKKTKN